MEKEYHEIRINQEPMPRQREEDEKEIETLFGADNRTVATHRYHETDLDTTVQTTCSAL